jgi:DNA-binding response OmpR family regulator
MSRGTKPTVLLVEADASLRRLIALGLEYRGLQVIEASSPFRLPSLEAARPDLLVLDVDGSVKSDRSLLATVQAHPYLAALPIVVLAWECLMPAGVVGGADEEQGISQAQVTCLTKPFDARALHATIEELLVTNTLQEMAPAQEIFTAAQTAEPAPSIWPLLTAAGLFLAFIGLMGSLAVTFVGLLVVLVSLLWWTVGTKGSARVSVSS